MNKTKSDFVKSAAAVYEPPPVGFKQFFRALQKRRISTRQKATDFEVMEAIHLGMERDTAIAVLRLNSSNVTLRTQLIKRYLKTHLGYTGYTARHEVSLLSMLAPGIKHLHFKTYFHEDGSTTLEASYGVLTYEEPYSGCVLGDVKRDGTVFESEQTIEMGGISSDGLSVSVSEESLGKGSKRAQWPIKLNPPIPPYSYAEFTVWRTTKDQWDVTLHDLHQRCDRALSDLSEHQSPFWATLNRVLSRQFFGRRVPATLHRTLIFPTDYEITDLDVICLRGGIRNIEHEQTLIQEGCLEQNIDEYRRLNVDLNIPLAYELISTGLIWRPAK